MITVTNTGGGPLRSFGKSFFIDVLPAVMTLGRVGFLKISGMLSV